MKRFGELSIESSTGTMQTEISTGWGMSQGAEQHFITAAVLLLQEVTAEKFCIFKQQRGNVDICKDVNLSGINGLELWAGNGQTSILVSNLP